MAVDTDAAIVVQVDDDVDAGVVVAVLVYGAADSAHVDF